MLSPRRSVIRHKIKEENKFPFHFLGPNTSHRQHFFIEQFFSGPLPACHWGLPKNKLGLVPYVAQPFPPWVQFSIPGLPYPWTVNCCKIISQKMKFSVSPNWSHLGMGKNGWSEFTFVSLCCLRSIWLLKRVFIHLTQSLIGRIWGSKRQEWKRHSQGGGNSFEQRKPVSSMAVPLGLRVRGETEGNEVRVAQAIRPRGPWERAASKRERVFFQQGSAQVVPLPQSIFYPLPIPFALSEFPQNSSI